MTTLQFFISLAIQMLTLFSLVIGVFKVLNRQIEEFQQRENRMLAAEVAIRELQAEIKILNTLDVRMTDVTREIERMRTRLDRFLDGNPKTSA